MTEDTTSRTRRSTGPDPARVPANAHTLIRLERHVQAARTVVDAKVLGGSGVTWCGYLLLCTAVQRDRMDFRELADRARIAAGTVPHLVAGLHRAGWLSRTVEPARDGGRVLVTVTPTGRAKLAAIHAALELLAGPLLTGIRDLVDPATAPASGSSSDVDQRSSDVDGYGSGPAPLARATGANLERL
jgi:DNA-binding MarR family transcriptional regulator